MCEVLIIEHGPLAGQFGAFARLDNPAPLPVGYCLPYCGDVVPDGIARRGYELHLPRYGQFPVRIRVARGINSLVLDYA